MYSERKGIGRPCLPIDSRQARVSLSISKSTLLLVDGHRGATNRSKYIESILQGKHNGKKQSKEYAKKNGIYYTPSKLAKFLADRVITYLIEDIKQGNSSVHALNNDIRILDPACGKGELLLSVWGGLVSQGYRLNHHLDPIKILCGIDKDHRAIFSTRRNILSLINGHQKKISLFPRLCSTNALFPFNYSDVQQGWKRIKKHFNAESGFDIVIANPPWGAEVDTYKDKLVSGSYKLCQGQFDTSDLFIECALSITKPNGYIAFIVPDSLFGYEREKLRESILKNTHIKYIGRFGEKIFSEINRACAIIICKYCKPEENSRVHCLRINPESREKILTGTSTFEEEDHKHFHSVLQTRFLSNKGRVFDIDINSREETLINQFRGHDSTFGNYLQNSRGVELSKHGLICQCLSCRKWLPLPKKEPAICKHCRKELINWQHTSISIVQENKVPNAEPFIVGESIRRYSLQPHLWISTSYEGINYKDRSNYSSPKIVVRKTGVGISATIDYSESYTNQVVYIFKPKASTDANFSFPIEFFLGLLNSRAIYYFLAKTYGETEWRSHPYITQKQILSLPLPNLSVLNRKISSINILSELVRKSVKTNTIPSPLSDAKIERLVADLYGLDRKDYDTIYNTLGSVQELLPVRALKSVSPKEIFTNIG